MLTIFCDFFKNYSLYYEQHIPKYFDIVCKNYFKISLYSPIYLAYNTSVNYYIDMNCALIDEIFSNRRIFLL